MPIEHNTPEGLKQVGLSPPVSPANGDKGKRIPVVCRRVDVATIETRRLEKGLSRLRLCAEAKIDPAAYLNLLRYQGRRSRDGVIIGVARALGLAIKDIVTITPGCEEAT